MRLLGECRDSLDTVKRVGFELKEEDGKSAGFVNPNSSEAQTSGNYKFYIVGPIAGMHQEPYLPLKRIK